MVQIIKEFDTFDYITTKSLGLFFIKNIMKSMIIQAISWKKLLVTHITKSYQYTEYIKLPKFNDKKTVQ